MNAIVEKETSVSKAIAYGIIGAGCFSALVYVFVWVFVNWLDAPPVFDETFIRALYIGAAIGFVFFFGTARADQRYQVRLSREGDKEEILSERPILSVQFVGYETSARCIVVTEGRTPKAYNLYALTFKAGKEPALREVREVVYDENRNRYSEESRLEVVAPKEWFQNQIPTNTNVPA